MCQQTIGLVHATEQIIPDAILSAKASYEATCLWLFFVE